MTTRQRSRSTVPPTSKGKLACVQIACAKANISLDNGGKASDTFEFNLPRQNISRYMMTKILAVVYSSCWSIDVPGCERGAEQCIRHDFLAKEELMVMTPSPQSPLCQLNMRNTTTVPGRKARLQLKSQSLPRKRHRVLHHPDAQHGRPSTWPRLQTASATSHITDT
ncbi:hypothetical protein BM1_10931 [Bipolaris maydis]|nr:hypothetical protein BM1_10931 [Bipolaris maydis]